MGATGGEPPPGFTVDHNRTRLGHGKQVYAAARGAVRAWRMFRLGWVEASPEDAAIAVTTTVAILARAGPLWTLNACRIVYVLAEERRYGFAYGTLPGHVERGEERFTVAWDNEDVVWYDILAYSRPHHPLARLGYPLTRRLQRRFAVDSMAAMVAASASR